MQIKTRYLGEITVEEGQITCFPQGLPAFEEQRRFVFLPFDDSGIFFYMQSVDDVGLCLVVCDPFSFFPDYQIELGDQECRQLELDDPHDAALFVILTIPDDFKKTTANLMAPLVINARINLGLQFIPCVSDNNIKQPIFPAAPEQVPAAGKRGSGC